MLLIGGIQVKRVLRGALPVSYREDAPNKPPATCVLEQRLTSYLEHAAYKSPPTQGGWRFATS